jgi:hypothetical protein
MIDERAFYEGLGTQVKTAFMNYDPFFGIVPDLKKQFDKSVVQPSGEALGRGMVTGAVNQVKDGISSTANTIKDKFIGLPWYGKAGVGLAALGLPLLMMNRKRQEQQPAININFGGMPQSNRQFAFPKPGGITG